MGRLRGIGMLALACQALLMCLSPGSGASAATEPFRIVPQLELTDLHPKKVAFAPDDDTLLMVVNDNGRIDIFDISNPGRPVKITEIGAGAEDAAFTPKGTPRGQIEIVSGGRDGTVRLWTLDGEAGSEPFKGHEGSVWSVGFSPDGGHILSGDDGTVELDSNLAQSRSLVFDCAATRGLGFVDRRFFWVGCSDRIRIYTPTFEPVGALFLAAEGAVAEVYAEGVNVPSDRMQDPFRAIAPGGQVIWQRHAVPELPISRVRQVLFDEWTQSERIQEFARQTYAAAETTYDALPVWAKAVFWPALLWQLTILGATGLWVVRPHLLAQWAMPAIGTPQIPTWQWLAGALTLFGFLGTTRRPLAAWLRKNRADLFEQCFAGREPVTERERYCPLIHDADIAAFGGAVAVGTPVRVWITGVGGNGKSALFSSPMTPWPSCSRPGGRSRAGRV
jgi:hypothetical protein